MPGGILKVVTYSQSGHRCGALPHPTVIRRLWRPLLAFRRQLPMITFGAMAFAKSNGRLDGGLRFGLWDKRMFSNESNSNSALRQRSNSYMNIPDHPKAHLIQKRRANPPLEGQDLQASTRAKQVRDS